MTEPVAAPELWGVVELPGYVSVAGRLSERQFAGAGFIQVEIPAADPNVWLDPELIGPGAVRRIRLSSEAQVRQLLERMRPRPAQLSLLPPGTVVDDDEDLDDEDVDDEDLEASTPF